MIPLAAILSIGEKVLDKVMPDPGAKAEAQAKLMELAQQGQLVQSFYHRSNQKARALWKLLRLFSLFFLF